MPIGKWYAALAGFGTIAFIAGLPTRAAAYTDPEISAFLKRRYSCPVLEPQGTKSLAVRGIDGAVQLFTYGAEGCPGLGFSGVSFALAVPGPSGIRLLTPQPTPYAVKEVAASEGFIVATSYDYAPNDPRCCPSLLVRQRWVVSGNRLVKAP